MAKICNEQNCNTYNPCCIFYRHYSYFNSFVCLCGSNIKNNMNNLKHNSIFTQPDEKIILITRKHWIKFARDVIIITILGFFAFAVLFKIINSTGHTSPIFVFALAVIMLIIWISFFVAWTNHYLDIWIVTNKRIIDIEQINLFHRTKSTMRLERVQNVGVKRKGVLEEIFNFGTISVETAGYKTFVAEMNNIPDPNGVARTIMELVDSVTEHKNKLTHTNLGSPTHSE